MTFTHSLTHSLTQARSREQICRHLQVAHSRGLKGSSHTRDRSKDLYALFRKQSWRGPCWSIQHTPTHGAPGQSHHWKCHQLWVVWGRDGAHLQHQGRKQHHSNSAGEPAGGRSLAPMFRDSVAGATAQLGSLRPQGQDPREDQTRSGPRKEDESCSCCLSP